MIILEAARLIFREHEPTDLEAYCAMEADPEVRRTSEALPVLAKTQNAKFVM